MPPDACVTLAWSDTGSATLYGPQTRAWWAEGPTGSSAVGVTLRPGTIPRAIAGDVRELVGTTVDLATLLSTAEHRRFVEAIGGAQSEDARLATMQREALRLFGSSDQRVALVAAMLRADPSVAGSVLSAELGWSERQLHRRCVRALGFGPATLRRLMRFERFLDAACAERDTANLARIAAVAGYADQQHLAHDCRALADRTPRELLDHC